MGPTIPLPLLRVYVACITKYLPDVLIGISLIDIIMTAVASVSKSQTDMPYQEVVPYMHPKYKTPSLS